MIEDDIIPSSPFFSFMIRSLIRYYNYKQVCQISGFLPKMQCIKPNKSFFLPVTTSWGWGTWDDRWFYFLKFLNTNYKSKIINVDINKFNIDKNYPFFKILRKHCTTSWAILWYLFNFLEKKYTVFPPTSLVFNSGFESSSSNCQFSEITQEFKTINCKIKFKYPKKIRKHKQAALIYKGFRPKIKLYKVPQKIYEKLKRLLS